MLIKNNVGPESFNGLICNFDLSGNLMTNSNTFKVYLWVMSLSPTASKQLDINGCDPAGSTCTKDSDFTIPIATPNTYNTNDLKVELITIVKHASNANEATVKINAGAVNT